MIFHVRRIVYVVFIKSLFAPMLCKLHWVLVDIWNVAKMCRERNFFYFASAFSHYDGHKIKDKSALKSLAKTVNIQMNITGWRTIFLNGFTGSSFRLIFLHVFFFVSGIASFYCNHKMTETNKMQDCITLLVVKTKNLSSPNRIKSKY